MRQQARPGNRQPIFRPLIVLTRLSRNGSNEMLIETTVEGSASPRARRGRSVRCTSKGTLELRIAQLANEALTQRIATDGA
ncbi:MAG: hypothetical protein OEY63_06425 [Gemmatimonadota bacterium]|nr:hypothetical protein [Gemmatimonadota bacterium]MDH5805983.1 hypothetical protein [Gemmatimonadota bacterium]